MNRLIGIVLLLLAGTFLFTAEKGHAQSIDSAEYFFDIDPGVGNGMPLALSPSDTINDTLNISTAGLLPGFHYLYIRVRDTNELWSVYEGGLFHVYDTLQAASAPIDSAEYFFGFDPGIDSGLVTLIQPGDTIADTVLIPTAGLAPGFHFAYARVQDTNNVWSFYEGAHFYLYDTIPAEAPSAWLSKAEYFYLKDTLGLGTSLALNAFAPADSIVLNDTLATAPLPAGKYSLYARAMDTLNHWGLYDYGNFRICLSIPVADFSADTVCPGSFTTFTDLTSGLDTVNGYAYYWDFNNDSIVDDTTSGGTAHIYQTSGTHTVVLWVDNDNGCADTIIKTIYVDSVPVVTLNFPVDTFCKDDTVLLSGGFPAGGVWGGPGVYGGSFYTDSLGTGQHIITYTYFNADSCSAVAFDTLFISPCLGITDLQSGAATLQPYPNPFQSETTLDLTSFDLTGNEQLEIRNVMGELTQQVPVSNSHVKINASNWTPGIYFFRLKNGHAELGRGLMIRTK